MAAVRGCVPDANLGGRTNHRPTLGRRHIAGLTAGPWLWRPRSAPPGLPQCRCPSMSVALQHGRHPPLDAVPHVQSLSPIAPCNAPDIRPVSPPPTHTPTPTPPRHLQGTPMPSLPPFIYTHLSQMSHGSGPFASQRHPWLKHAHMVNMTLRTQDTSENAISNDTKNSPMPSYHQRSLTGVPAGWVRHALGWV